MGALADTTSPSTAAAREDWRAVSARMRSENAVFIVGVPRSGTTALRHTLDQHPSFRALRDQSPESRVFSLPERIAKIRSKIAKPAFRYMLDDEDAARALLEHIEAMQPGPKGLRGWLAGLAEDRARGTATLSWRLQRYDHLLRIYFHHAKRARHCQRLLEKTPRHVFVLDQIFATFPAARVLLCVRHPVDVYSSFRKRLERDRSAGKDERRLRWLAEDVDSFVERYQRISRIILARSEGEPERCHLVRYEDLTDDPRSTLEALCHFLREPFDEEALLGGQEIERDEFGSPVPQKQIAANEKKWEHFLSREEAERVETSLEEPLGRLGYSRYTGR